MMPNSVNELNKSSNSANSRLLLDTNSVSSFSSAPPPPPHFLSSNNQLTPVNSMTADHQHSYNFEHRNSIIQQFMSTRFNNFMRSQVNQKVQDHIPNFLPYHIDENAYSDASASPLTPHLSSSESDSFTHTVQPLRNETGNNLCDKIALDARNNYTNHYL